MKRSSSGRASLIGPKLSVPARMWGCRETSGRRECCTSRVSAARRHATLLSMTPSSRLRRLLLPLFAALVMPASAAAAERPTAHTSYVAGEVVVRYERSADRTARAAVQRETGVGGPRVFAPRTRVLTIRDGQSVSETLRELRARPDVATASPNPIARASAFVPPDPGNAGVPG